MRSRSSFRDPIVASLILLALVLGHASRAPAAPPPRPAPSPALPQLPADAREVIAQYEQAYARAMAELEAKLAPQRQEMVAQLKILQDRYTKAGALDEAVAIRDRIRQLVPPGSDPAAPLPNPGTLTAYRDRTNQSFYIQVTGAAQGSVWGTDVYSDDSNLAAAAVHAGLLKPGETATLRVTILPGCDSYAASTRNGIASAAWGPYTASYSIARLP
jgi:hypothetical protein